MTDSNSTNSLTRPSLLPYLQTGKSGIHICFTPRKKSETEELVKNGSIPFPFQTIDKNDSFAHILNAWLESDAGSRITDLSIWLQRDDAHPDESEEPKATNTDIEQLWHQAHTHLSENHHSKDRLIQLGEQMSDNGRLLPFQPLLVCQYRHLFFSPPCPLCGGLLDLCRDDELLIKAGFKTFSQSLTRYLYCPTCYQLAGETDFYNHRSSSDNRMVKTAAELITSLRPLVSANRSSPDLPCSTCSQAPQCHADDGPVARRLAPFAFYPFYMIAFIGKTNSESTLSVSAAARDNIPSPSSRQRTDHDEYHQSKTTQNNTDQNIKYTGEPPVSREIPSDNQQQVTSDAIPSSRPDKTADDESIALILDRIHRQWRKKASDESVKNDHPRSPMPPTHRTPSEPKLNQSIDRSIPIPNENQDLNKTIIVQTGKNMGGRSVNTQPRKDIAPSNDAKHFDDRHDNKDLPETIIVKANGNGQGSIWPQDPPQDIDRSKYQENPKSKKLSQSEPVIDPQVKVKNTGIRPTANESDALPETIIVRPGEKVPPQRGNATRTNHDSSIWPQETADTPPDRPFTFGNTPPDDPEQSHHFSKGDKELLKTFKLDAHKKHHLTDTKQSKPEQPITEKGDDKLAETILVPPRSDKKEKR